VLRSVIAIEGFTTDYEIPLLTMAAQTRVSKNFAGPAKQYQYQSFKFVKELGHQAALRRI
jgi:hypothetical protein